MLDRVGASWWISFMPGRMSDGVQTQHNLQKWTDWATLRKGVKPEKTNKKKSWKKTTERFPFNSRKSGIAPRKPLEVMHLPDLNQHPNKTIAVLGFNRFGESRSGRPTRLPSNSVDLWQLQCTLIHSLDILQRSDRFRMEHFESRRWRFCIALNISGWPCVKYIVACAPQHMLQMHWLLSLHTAGCWFLQFLKDISKRERERERETKKKT